MWFALFALALVACQGQTVGEATASGGASGDASVGGSGGTSGAAGSAGAAGSGGTAGGVHGPGKWGALPAGYCCTQDDECRYRKCSDFGGVKLCSDECDTNDACNTGQNLICSQLTFYCEPAGTPSCIPADQWVNGSKSLGACCVATGDGHSGQECESNRCVAVGDLSNPYICTQPCPCPASYQCFGGLFCAPVASSYTCQ